MGSFLIFLIGTVSLLAADILSTKFLDDSDMALWAEMRALFGVLAVLLTLGLEMVLIRSPKSARILLRLIIVQTLILGLPLGCAVHHLGYMNSPWAATLFGAGAAFITAQGQYFRSQGAFVVSQLAQQGWRLATLATLIYLAFHKSEVLLSLDLIVALAVFICSLLGWCFVIVHQRNGDNEYSGLVNHYSISFRFFCTNLVLQAALFGEQLLVNGLGSNLQASIFFTHMTYFLLPVTVVSAYLGFRIGPWLRDHPDSFESAVVKYRYSLFLLTLGVVAIIQVVGLLGWQIIKPAVSEVNVFLIFSFFFSASLRIYYTFSSAYNGIFATPHDHDTLIVAQVMLLLCLAAFVYVFRHAVDILYLVAIAGGINWLARTAISDVVMRNRIERRQKVTS